MGGDVQIVDVKDKPSINLNEPGVFHRFSVRDFPDYTLRYYSMAHKKTKRSARLSGRLSAGHVTPWLI